MVHHFAAMSGTTRLSSTSVRRIRRGAIRWGTLQMDTALWLFGTVCVNMQVNNIKSKTIQLNMYMELGTSSVVHVREKIPFYTFNKRNGFACKYSPISFFAFTFVWNEICTFRSATVSNTSFPITKCKQFESELRAIHTRMQSVAIENCTRTVCSTSCAFLENWQDCHVQYLNWKFNGLW